MLTDGGKKMCEIFCFNSNKPKQVNQCLECFYNHSEEHPDGWGLANMQSNEYKINKEPVKASCSENLKNILSHPIIGKNIFAHIRLATVGEIISPNCHPFTETDNNNRTWILIHNGTIFDYPELDKYQEKEKGNTDSERILLYIIDEINKLEHEKNTPTTIKERFNIISNLICRLSKNNKVNIMIYDGEITYIHSNMKDTMHYLKNKEGILIASSPLDDEEWRPVELNKVFGLIDGKIVFESKKHKHEFSFTEKHTEFMKKHNIKA